MNPSRTMVVSLIALLIVGAAAYVFQSRKAAPQPPVGFVGQATSPQPLQSDAPKLLTRAIPKKLPRRTIAAAVAPPSNASPSDVLSAESQAADAGDPVALRDVAFALHACAFADMGSDDQMKEHVAAQIANVQRAAALSGQHVDSDGLSKQMYTQRQQIRESCAHVSPQQAKGWLSAMEKAAAAGDNAAREQYYKDALGEMSQRDRSDFPDEYARRRSLGFNYLADALTDGDCSSQVLSGLHDTASDLATSYVYGSILVGGAKNAGYDEQTAINRYLQGLSAGVSDSDLLAAQNTASYVSNMYCRP